MATSAAANADHEEEEPVFQLDQQKNIDKRSFIEVKSKYLARNDKIEKLEGKLRLLSEQQKLRQEEVAYLRNRNKAKTEEVEYYNQHGGVSQEQDSSDDDMNEVWEAFNLFDQADKLQEDLLNDLTGGNTKNMMKILDPSEIENFFASTAESAPFQANIDNLDANRELLPEVKEMIRILVNLNRKMKEDEGMERTNSHYDPSQALLKLRDYVVVGHKGEFVKFRILQRMSLQDLIDVSCKYHDCNYGELVLVHRLPSGERKKFPVQLEESVKTVLYGLGGSVDYQPELELVTEEEALGADERKTEQEKEANLRAAELLKEIENDQDGVRYDAHSSKEAAKEATHEVSIEKLLARTKYNAQLEEKWKNDLLDSRKERIHLARVFAQELRNQGKNRRSDYQSLIVHIVWLACAMISIGWRRSVEEALSITEAYNTLLITEEYSHGSISFVGLDHYNTWCANTGFTCTKVANLLTDAAQTKYFSNLVWGPFRTIDETATLANIFQYLYNVLIPQLFPTGFQNYDTYYGFSASGSGDASNANRFYLGIYNQLIAGVRLRQIRVKGDSCSIDNEFTSVSDVCYGDYEVSGILNRQILSKLQPFPTAEMSDFTATQGFGSCTTASGDCSWISGFSYQTAEALKASSQFTGTGVTYDDGSGYAVDILIDRTLSQQDMQTRALLQIEQLSANGWLGAPTRAVYINWTTYSHVYNYFTVCQIVFYHTPGGEVDPKYNFKNIKMDPVNARPESIAYFIFYCLHLLFVWHNLLKFCKVVWNHFRGEEDDTPFHTGDDEMDGEVEPSKVVTFLQDVWNLIFFVMVVLYSMGFISTCMTWFRSESWQFDLQRSSFQDMEDVARGYNNGFYFDGLGLSVAILYSFRYMKSTARYFLIFSTLGKASYDLLVFIIIFAIAFLGFVFWVNISFGPAIEQFRTIQESLPELSLMIVGQFRFDEMLEVNEFMAILFFVAYMLFIFFILTNIFLAILADAFIKAKVDERWGAMKEQFIKSELNIDYSTLAILKGIFSEYSDRLTNLYDALKKRWEKRKKKQAKLKRERDEKMAYITEEKARRKDRMKKAKAQAARDAKKKKKKDDDDDDEG